VLYDVFISHASEDKDAFVRPMAEKLRESRIAVWYDEFSLTPGDSLRRSIDQGLAKSRYGVVVLSSAFFAKNWTQWELDGLVARQMSGGSKIIIPIWHGISRREIEAHSPPLADKVAIQSSSGLDKVVRDILAVTHPEGSTLLIARDVASQQGMLTPVVTDDWWLDVLESMAERHWQRWSFDLPVESGDDPTIRGHRLAWHAMQYDWQSRAESQRVTQMTHPSEVLAFIEEQPGLKPLCLEQPERLLCWAPQMALRGFGGFLEPALDGYLEKSRRTCEQQRQLSNGRWGSRLTTTGSSPVCDEVVALRHLTFGNYEPALVACAFVQGPGAGFGRHTRCYDTIDYIAWFLSTSSDWMPRDRHAYLVEGLKAWATWVWLGNTGGESGYDDTPETGHLEHQLRNLEKHHPPKIRLRPKAQVDLQQRLAFAADLLDLPESGGVLADRFMGVGFIEGWLASKRSRKGRSSKRGG
jgi:hypothetical protein